jgi:hypothetical protein
MGDANGRYILIGQSAVPCEDLIEWATWLETADRVVFQTVVGAWRVSTVFLGLDHGFGGLPLLFETMIFLAAADHGLPGESLTDWSKRTAPMRDAADQELVNYQTRYPDWADAERGHEKAVRFAEARTGCVREAAAEPVTER